jgi:catecholate siderophore receptor
MTDFSVNVGGDETLRGTMDMARPLPLLGDGAAWRLNVLAHSGAVVDRDGAEAKRLGLAPSFAIGIGSATEMTLSYLKQTSDDGPDYGLPWLGQRPAPVPRHNFYGFDSDYLETDANIGTFRLTHAVGESVSLDARFRIARYTRESRITEPLITDPLAEGTPLSDIAVFRYVFLGDSDETLSTVQIAATLDRQTGSIEHTVVTGLELSREASDPVFAFGIGAPGTNLLNPNPSEPFTATTTDPRVVADTTARTLALYALDTLRFSDAWQLTLGARWDRFDSNFDAVRYPGPPTPFNSGDVSGHESFDQADNVLSYRAALVYKPKESISLYLASSTSFNPSAQSLSLLTSGRGLGVGNALLDPEENRSIEAGLKADFDDGRWSFSSALFEINKTNARIPDPSNPGFNTLGGKQRIRGLSFNVDGTIVDRLYGSAGYTYLDGAVIKAAPGALPGADLANAPEHSLSVWLDYLITDRFDFGFGARYVSEQLAQNTGGGKSVPSYRLFDAMGRYHLSDTIALKLNLANLTNEYYFDQLHPWHVVPGAGFTATFAVNVIY